MMTNERCSILGVHADPMTVGELLSRLEHTIETKKKLIVASLNLHGIYNYYNSPVFQDFHRQAIKRIDGMPLVYLGKLRGYPLNRDHRVTWVDLIHPLMDKACHNDWKIFYLGADEKSVSLGVEKLRDEHQGLMINYQNGYFSTEKTSVENRKVIQKIVDFRPDILIVGMGMPRQEKWILDNKEDLNIPIIMTCGAAIEYVAGTVSTPPRWMGRLGMEWLFRLSENPKRFFFRYLIEPWIIIYYVLKSKF